MNVLLAEDDEIQRKNLKNTIQQIDKYINIYECEDREEALRITINNKIDIFYIDISLKNSSGLDFAMDLRQIPLYEFSFIVFLTTNVEYITQSFKKVHCYDYIIKPYDAAEIVDMTKRFIAHSENTKSAPRDKVYVIFELIKGISLKVYVDDIIFIEVKLRTCMVHTVNGAYKVNDLGLKNILKLISCYNIIQCHRSFAVNVNHIREIVSIDNRLSEIYFEDYDKSALLGYKFKDTIMEQFK
ncbi:LytTR family DNA-binding domain-containing protein [Clostridium algoriphilum]|uniref:LytR/AlgR family response regulator transcription factor n=1 Tax=Clostridium algoriphilum TaxID=198347 RepID=UPI001CF4A8D6|nr:LytTR family DNA-binding domain-containing protein [Clostridium algoriphilum]MCB2295584.1 LytTR family DNA-binding domain-containing protein [Clostridium algoriphilum]